LQDVRLLFHSIAHFGFQQEGCHITLWENNR
jgi:hypothetical protein